MSSEPGTLEPPRAGSRRGRGTGYTVLAAVLSASLLALFILPIIALFTFAPISEVLTSFNDSQVQAAFLLTLYASGLTVGICLALGVPLGYLLARRSFPGRTVVRSVVALPIVIPHLVVGLALLFLLEPSSIIGGYLARAGINLFQTFWAVVLVMVYVSAPYTVLASELAFRAVDERLVDAARSMGASRSRAFTSVTFPLATRGVITGALLSWARAVSEIGGFLIIAYAVYPPYSNTATAPLSVYIYDLYDLGNLPEAAAVSSLFLLIAFGIFILVRALERIGAVPWRRGEVSA